jgi:hypothetical protein
MLLVAKAKVESPPPGRRPTPGRLHGWRPIIMRDGHNSRDPKSLRSAVDLAVLLAWHQFRLLEAGLPGAGLGGAPAASGAARRAMMGC